MTIKPPLAEEYPGEPRPMYFTDRDGQILEALLAFDGLMGDYQLEQMFFTSDRQTRERLSILWQNGYLARIHPRLRPGYPCMVYWLGQRGAEYVAGLRGQGMDEFTWKAQPRENDIIHDLKVNDFRLEVVAAAEHPQLELEEWIGGYEFFVDPDEIKFVGLDGRKTKRRMIPDGYFVLTLNKIHRFRFLLELDLSTHDNPRFVRDKVLPTVVYLQSEAYRKRFGHNSGRMLTVTTSQRRLSNLKRSTEHALSSKAQKNFYFTTLELIADLKPDNLLTSPIWFKAGQDEPMAQFQL